MFVYIYVLYVVDEVVEPYYYNYSSRYSLLLWPLHFGLSSLSLLFLHVRCLLAFNLPYLYSFPLSLFLFLLLPFFPCWPHNSLTWLPQTPSSIHRFQRVFSLNAAAAFSSSFAHWFIYSSIRSQSLSCSLIQAIQLTLLRSFLVRAHTDRQKERENAQIHTALSAPF